MKKIYNALLIAMIIFLSLDLLPQSFQVINHVDTLACGDVILSQTALNGSTIDKGLAKTGFSFSNDTVELTYSTPILPDENEDVFIEQVNLPFKNGGFLPQDILFNPHNNKYYIYGYRKVLICDDNLEPHETINISNLDNFTVFYSDYHQQMIDVNTTSNEVYCLTAAGGLFSIDQYYNKTQLAAPLQDVFVMRASLKYCNEDQSLLYYLLVYDQQSNLKTIVRKYELTTQMETEIVEQGIICYDLDFLPNLSGYKICLATDAGVKMYDQDFSNPNTFEVTKSFDHIEKFNVHILAHEYQTTSIHVVDDNCNGFCLVSGTYSNLRFITTDEINNRIFTAGYTENQSGIDIFKYNILQGTYEFEENFENVENIYGLGENNQQVLACGIDKVVFIDKVNLNHTIHQSTTMGLMYRIAENMGINKCLTIQPFNGNAISFVPNQNKILDIGGQISASCYKDDKIYVAVHKYNQEGYILVLNATSGKIIHQVKPDFIFNPVDIFCSNRPEIANNRVYVVFVDMNDIDADRQVTFFSTENYQLSGNVVEFSNSNTLKRLITPNETICIGSKSKSCPILPEVRFYDFDLNVKAEPFKAVSGCVEEFDYIGLPYNYFLWTSRCNSKIYIFDDTIDTIEIKDSIYDTGGSFYSPITLAYDCEEDSVYISASSNKLFTVHLDSFNINEYSYITTTGNTIQELVYNPNDGFVYALAENFIYQIVNSTTPTVQFDLPIKYYEPVLNQKANDFIFNPEENRMYFNSWEPLDYRKKSTVMIFDFNNAEIINSDLEIVLFDKPFIVNNYRGTGMRSSYYENKKILYTANLHHSNITLFTTHTESRTLTGNWDWISFPCMPRLNNDPYGSQDLLENIVPLPSYIELFTKIGIYDRTLTYSLQNWNTQEIPTLISTRGYKYYSNSAVEQTLPVGGIVLDPSTPIPLSSQYENWIGYFLEYSLSPQDAFAGVWDQLTRISTEDWTMILENGTIIKGPALETPISYGDGLIVEVSENCELVWDHPSEATEDFSMPVTEYYSYEKKADYTPFYFEMDSAGSIREIALTVNDTCIGAAVVNPGDSVVEVNAYLAGNPSGIPIEVETWSGFKSARLGSRDYSVVDLPTGKRISRKVYTGEGRPYYVISFKAGQNNTVSPVVGFQPPSPNPFNRSVACSFVLERSAAVTLTVHDLQGHPVKTLMQGTYNEGYYETGWTGTSDTGQPAENGIYIIRLSANGRVIANEKVVLIR